MISAVIRASAAATLAAGIALAAGQAQSSVFVAWQVKGVPYGDTLNVRKYPASTSQKQNAYPNGTVLSMTGKCTGGIDLNELQGLPKWQQRQAVRTVWCQLWHDPAQNGNYVAGWVYGKYISPY